MSRFIIGDNHFYSASMIDIENRPFESVSEMNEYMIKMWNGVVTDDDTVFHLGDFIESNEESKIVDILNSLHGKIVLVRGNHETDIQIEVFKKFPNKITVSDFSIIVDEFWILSHMPIYINKSMPYANMFAHVHQNPIYPTWGPQHFCACGDRLNFVPFNFDVAQTKIKTEYSKAS